MTEGGIGGGRTKREERKYREDKGETRRGRETEKIEGGRESLWDCRGIVIMHPGSQ